MLRNGDGSGLSKDPRRDSREPRESPPRAKTKKPQDAAPSQRQLRVAEEIRHVLAGVFTRREFRDPDLAESDITVSEVRIGPDLKHATAFISRLGRTDVEALLPALRRATPWMRQQMGQSLTLRRVPELSFLPDRALDYATKINLLMRKPEIARDLKTED